MPPHQITWLSGQSLRCIIKFIIKCNEGFDWYIYVTLVICADTLIHYDPMYSGALIAWRITTLVTFEILLLLLLWKTCYSGCQQDFIWCNATLNMTLVTVTYSLKVYNKSVSMPHYFRLSLLAGRLAGHEREHADMLFYMSLKIVIGQWLHHRLPPNKPFYHLH